MDSRCRRLSAHGGPYGQRFTLWAWGNKLVYGQLGDGTTVLKAVPLRWARRAGGHRSPQVITTSRRQGRRHALDLGQQFLRPAGGWDRKQVDPRQNVLGRQGVVGQNWPLGQFHTAAVKTDGTLWTWGKNDYGQLGERLVLHQSADSAKNRGQHLGFRRYRLSPYPWDKIGWHPVGLGFQWLRAVRK